MDLSGTCVTFLLDNLVLGNDTLWILISSILVFWMQSGFAMLESGCVRQKNSQNILFKNFLDILITTVLWWLFGYGISYGKDVNGFVGNSLFAGTNFDNTNHYRDWMFQWAFSGTCVTIVSGSMAERTKISGYILLSIIMNLLIYPWIVHWTWGGGWLTEMGFSDFAQWETRSQSC